MVWRSLFSVSMLLAVLSSAAQVAAAPAKVFTPHLEEIQRTLPADWSMRLPTKVLLGGPADDEFIEQLIVRLFPSASPPGLTIALFSCANGPQPCLVGSFSVESLNSSIAQQEFKRHVAAAAPIRLAGEVRGYFLEGTARKPPSIFSSVMWEQNQLYYTASFLVGERENLLRMAYSMANNVPIRSGKTLKNQL
jgi:hypothetical protein